MIPLLRSVHPTARPRIAVVTRVVAPYLCRRPCSLVRSLPRFSSVRHVALAALERIDAVAVVAVLAFLLTFTALDLSGHRLFVVSGASMEPAIARGSLIVVRPTAPDAIAVGDVVTFQHRGATVTHRVSAIDERGGARAFTTKGDANDVLDADAVSFDDRAGLLVAQLPLLGYVFAVVQWYGRTLSIGLGLVIAAWALRRYRLRPFPVVARA